MSPSRITLVAALTASLASFVNAHGYVLQIGFGSNLVDTWLPFDDPYKSPVPSKPTRKFNSDGPIQDVSSPSITCNTNSAAGGIAPAVKTVVKGVQAGEDVVFHWKTWPSDHRGPVMTYLANCGGDCTTFDATKGNVWFKIDHAGFANGKWATDKLIADGSKWTVKIPASIASGQYLLRHEILALHGASAANGAQFYPSCNQIEIVSSGTQKPAGVALPGAYKSSDPGILVDIWSDNFKSYVIPGPAVFSSSGTSSPVTPAAGSSSVTPAATPTPTGTATGSATTTYVVKTSTRHTVATQGADTCDGGNNVAVVTKPKKHRMHHKVKPKKHHHHQGRKHVASGKAHHGGKAHHAKARKPKVVAAIPDDDC